ncbi:hypothetical protein COU59_00235 [Candidatus Pacearchaeota archaeon CG10_big_fil_rev_8_21_14_0_10_34_12]|nr:MAG: hypothetical protein COU59_00235 [Candidatus Pacearchaeota archaeon CG10_big_fil_rev_8_21_14_0_10_34_12]
MTKIKGRAKFRRLKPIQITPCDNGHYSAESVAKNAPKFPLRREKIVYMGEPGLLRTHYDGIVNDIYAHLRTQGTNFDVAVRSHPRNDGLCVIVKRLK